MGQRGGEEGLAGDEQDHELGCDVELVEVAFLRELTDVGLDLLGMLRERGGARLFALRLDRGEVGIHWGFGVHHDLAAAGQAHDEVRAQAAGVGVLADLFFEVAVFEHAGHLDHAPELQLAPAAARLRLA